MEITHTEFHACMYVYVCIYLYIITCVHINSRLETRVRFQRNACGILVG
jgi:hypothetical protein